MLKTKINPSKRTAARAKRLVKTWRNAGRDDAAQERNNSEQPVQTLYAVADLAVATGTLSVEQRAQVSEAKLRVAAALAQPSLNIAALRARARRAAEWERAHGHVSAFAGTRRG